MQQRSEPQIYDKKNIISFIVEHVEGLLTF